MGIWEGQEGAGAGSIAGNRRAARLLLKRLRQTFAAMVLLTGA